MLLKRIWTKINKLKEHSTGDCQQLTSMTMKKLYIYDSWRPVDIVNISNLTHKCTEFASYDTTITDWLNVHTVTHSKQLLTHYEKS